MSQTFNKLAGTSWKAPAKVLRILCTLGLGFSTATYCALVWTQADIHCCGIKLRWIMSWELYREYRYKIIEKPQIPIHNLHLQQEKLILNQNILGIKQEWRRKWNSDNIPNNEPEDPSEKNRRDLPRKSLSTLIRFQTGQGRCHSRQAYDKYWSTLLQLLFRIFWIFRDLMVISQPRQKLWMT